MTDTNSSDSDKRAEELRLDELGAYLKAQPQQSSEPITPSLRNVRLKTAGFVLAIAIVGVLIGSFLFSEVYQYSIGPPEIESSYETKRQRGSAFAFFNRVVAFSDEAVYEFSSPGYASASETFVSQSEKRVFSIELTPLPGYLDIVVTQEFPVSIHVDGELQTQLEAIELTRGRHLVAVMRGDVKLATYAIDVEGFGNPQEILIDLADYQAVLRVATQPKSATIELNGTRLGQGVFEGGVPAIASQLQIRAAGYDSKTIDIAFERGETVDLGSVALDPSPINTTIKTNPSSASVLVDGSFVGESATSFTLLPGHSYELVVSKPGYREHRAVLSPEIGKDISQNIDFEQKTIRVDVQGSPVATILLNGIPKGEMPLTLDVYPGDVIEARREGLTPQSKTVSEEHGANQSITFELLEPSKHAYHFAPERFTASGDLELIRFPPVGFQKSIGMDRDESISVEITRPFYLGATEVTIDAYRLYQNSVQGPDKHPMSDISWIEAVKFCNWLSAQHGLQPFYQISPYDVVEGIDTTSLGFRLPTEFEWEAGASFNWREGRVLEPFEWGTSQTIPIAFGNLAGRETAKIKSQYFDSFTDNHEKEAPVASYLPNANGLYDITGNVSEWTHNYYQIRRETNGGPDYLGPRTGFANVVKGSNYETSTIDEVATDFREFETGKRSTLGFRVARWIY
ncbi:MAG: SUMF1/EgtB/PvdO family nonheme iron enzyme [Gammaproteobacteria bacterium]|nr:SUMF1/EgtB/PvdO family nonheme iron enzyme [Gammaproteobacteria bacterium]